MPFTVFTLCSILAPAFVGVLDTHQKGEAMVESANFNGSSESMGGLGGGVVNKIALLLPTANSPMETLFTEYFVNMPAMLTSGTKVSCPRGCWIHLFEPCMGASTIVSCQQLLSNVLHILH